MTTPTTPIMDDMREALKDADKTIAEQNDTIAALQRDLAEERARKVPEKVLGVKQKRRMVMTLFYVGIPLTFLIILAALGAMIGPQQ